MVNTDSHLMKAFWKDRHEILAGSHLNDGEYELIKNVSGFKYPIKIVAAVESDIVTVITNYPLKKRRWQ